ncbi:MFS transporter [Bifidobacterium sp. SMB2]|uniref:MFS transporter n=1 Tax=Bifidobacterium saimiriisciurei TaxID=2661627 RepID=A0ABX0CDL2_9BIFI|nr:MULTISPECIES: MFS transporter [Bifidobacterium]NEG96768.1 MFS transporter [Bifidobacterium sp. SMB2]NEH12334.1 MFS transporter [Bifidobacterium saimiriisciurei]
MSNSHPNASRQTIRRTPGKRRESPYRTIFRTPGAKAFSAAAAVARLPISMMGLGIVLALNHIYDNWTTAGVMSAVYVLSAAVVTPFYARLFDRFGQRRVGRVALVLQVIAMLSFALGALLRIPIPALFVLAVLMGITQFAFGALVRTRWAWALRGEKDDTLLNAAYAFESAIDETVFVLGPILAAFLATSVHPVSQLVMPALCALAGGMVFFSLKSTQPPVVATIADIASDGSGSVVGGDGNVLEGADTRKIRARGHVRSALVYPGIALLVVVFVAFNMSFSAFDVSVTAITKSMGIEKIVGLQLALFAVGSLVGALVFGSLKLRGSHWSHMVVLLAVLSIWYVGFRMSADNLVVLGVLEVFAGLFVAPTFATGNLIVKDIVPDESLTEGLSWLATGNSVGVSLGSSVAGVVLDAYGTHAGMWIPFAATACSVPLAAVAWLLARRRRR